MLITIMTFTLPLMESVQVLNQRLSITRRLMHCGGATLKKEYDSFMAVVCDPVFNGESIVTLLNKNKIEIEFS